MDVGLGSAPDSVIWLFAHQNEFIVISKDEDFLYLATKPEDKARLVWTLFRSPRAHTVVSLINLNEQYGTNGCAYVDRQTRAGLAKVLSSYTELPGCRVQAVGQSVLP
jgi:hypothetical protein